MMALFDESLFDGGPISPPLIPAPPSPPDGYLGRFQLGQSVPLLVQPVDDGGFHYPPDAAPVATIVGPGGDTIDSVKLPMVSDDLNFGRRYFLGFGLALGTYQVAYSYVVAGVESTSQGSFDLIGGGDPGGRVISMFAYERPEGRYVVAQLSGGLIAQGKNPTL